MPQPQTGQLRKVFGEAVLVILSDLSADNLHFAGTEIEVDLFCSATLDNQRVQSRKGRC